MKPLALSLVIAAVVALLLRVLAFGVYTVGGDAMSPSFHSGDRVIVSRWAYGFRTGREGWLIGYGRILPHTIVKGDIVAIDSPDPLRPGVALVRCAAVPGDTVAGLPAGGVFVLPRRADCADDDYYWMTPVAPRSTPAGAVPMRSVIGRAVGVAFKL